MNLKVPKETLGGCLEEPRTRSLKGAGLPPIRHGKTLCPKTAKRTKSPKKGGGDEVSSNRTGGMGPSNPRAKSRSPNPSFCSVLSRVKDWEVQAFTPKTALRDSVDVFKQSHRTSNSSVDSLIDGKNRNASWGGVNEINKSDFEPWKPSPTGSPDPTSAELEATGAGGVAGQGGTGTSGVKSATSILLKSTLSSNIGK